MSSIRFSWIASRTATRRTMTSETERRPDDLGFYHGGDWKGLTERLPYIARLGATATQLSPVSHRSLYPVMEKKSYYGYFTKDFATPNAHFGSMKTCRNSSTPPILWD